MLVCVLAAWAASSSALAQVGAVNGVPGVAADEALREAAAAADAARRLELAESILGLQEAEAGRSFDARYRAFLKADLASASLAALESFVAAGGEGNLRESGSPAPR